MKVNWLKVVDFGERVTATFAQAFLAFSLVTPLSDKQSLEGAAIAGALAAGKYAYVQVNAYLGSAT